MKFSKKLLSMVLAGALALSTGMSAFAASQTDISAVYEEIEINVVVPETGSAVINPYGLPVDLKDETGATIGTSISGHQIVTSPMAIANLAGVDLNVEAEVTTTLGRRASMEFAATAVAPTETAKKANVSLQVLKSATLTSNAVDDIATDFAAWDKDTAGDINAVLSTTAAVKTAGGPLTLTKSDDGTDPAAGGVALFRLNGTCAKNPTDPWTTDDSFTASIVFTFSPA